jgi:predicted alpha/beta-fold hydrolase
MKPFEPHRWLRQPDLMTMAAAVWPRRFPKLPRATERLFEVDPAYVPHGGTAAGTAGPSGEARTRLLAKCHWQQQPRQAPTLVAVHGLEGSADSSYMLGLAEHAFAVGFNALRLNQRNCGGTEQLTPTLYHSGLSSDFRAVLQELISRDGLPEIFFAGFSMGGNLVLKMAGEWGAAPPIQFRGVAAVCPSAEIDACVARIEQPRNRFYQWYFVRRLKRRMRAKIRLFPQRYRADGLRQVRSIRQFDDLFTAPHCGFANAAEYYARASALRIVAQIRVPALLIYAADDPLVPVDTAAHPALRNNAHIALLTPKHGGHCAFLAADPRERHWAEARVVEFCAERSRFTLHPPQV